MLKVSSFSVKALFDHCCAHVTKGIRQELHIIGDTGQMIMADLQQIAKALVNLINNALKYAPDTDQSILQSSMLPNSQIKILVKDFGPGIEKKSRIIFLNGIIVPVIKVSSFQVWVWAYIISAASIKSHGGKISSESEPGQGSTFWFTLPLELTGQ